jgi:hypothetical protein
MGLLYNELASTAVGPVYPISKSARFSRYTGAANYFTRTPSASGNRKTWTFSVWLKLGGYSTGAARSFFTTGVDQTNFNTFVIGGGNNNNGYWTQGGVFIQNTFALAGWRDCSAWKHFVYVYDSTQANSFDRTVVYENGIRLPLRDAVPITLNFDSLVNSTSPITIGAGVSHVASTAAIGQYDGNLAEIVFLDGVKPTTTTRIINGETQTVLTQLGEFNAGTGVWEARRWTGSYGTNGYYLNFSDGTSATTLGYDYSGNNNHFTPVNITRTNGAQAECWTNDVPSGNGAQAPLPQPSTNYCVLNQLDIPSDGFKLYANATAVADANHYGNRGTMAYPSIGNWYWEAVTATTTTASSAIAVGVATISSTLTTPLSGTSGAYGIYAVDNRFRCSSGTPTLISGGAIAAGTTIQVAYNAASRYLWIGINNSWWDSSGGTTGNPTTGANPTFTLPAGEYFPFVTMYSNAITANFGQVAFNYTPPSGFTTLCASNIPKSVVINGGNVTSAALYLGNGSSQTITNDFNMQPDLVWVKDRTNAEWHILTDSNTGASKYWSTNSLNQQSTGATTHINAFTSSGFTVGSAGAVNRSSATGDYYVAWQWQAGKGVTSANTVGQCASTVSANQAAGFSIIKYTGTGTTYGSSPNYITSIGHGLTVAPKVWMVKRLDAANNTYNALYTTAIDGTIDLFQINLTDAKLDTSASAVTSTTISLPFGNSNFGASGGSYVIYAWAEVPGFSKFGSYVGATISGTLALGPFIYLGFRPKFLLIKSSSATGDWIIRDSSRNAYNTNQNHLKTLYPNLADVELVGSPNIDFLANGFKLRTQEANNNTAGVTYFYMAFAENPFAQANAR